MLYEVITKRLKLDDDELEAALGFIKGLNPFPGRLYSAEETKYVTPDVQVKLKDGEFVIVINDEEIPVIGINPFFDRLSGEKHDKETDAFVKDNIRKARWFIQSIQQRNRTLLKVVRSIVEFQRPFFARGPKYLAPLTLKDIAGEVGVHETTVITSYSIHYTKLYDALDSNMLRGAVEKAGYSVTGVLP